MQKKASQSNAREELEESGQKVFATGNTGSNRISIEFVKLERACREMTSNHEIVAGRFDLLASCDGPQKDSCKSANQSPVKPIVQAA
jgi:hypothetical protein